MTIAEYSRPTPIPRLSRQRSTWQDYLAARDNPQVKKIAFHNGWLWFEMSHEGPNHAAFSDLMTAIIFGWVFLNPEQVIQSYGRCLIEGAETQACSPDLVIYKGEPIPRWQTGEPRRIKLSQHRVPDLVGEISDTSLNLDLDEQKKLYASLQIPEYWVIDVKGLRLFAFGLTDDGTYQSIDQSQVLPGLSVQLLEQTLERSIEDTNTHAATWLLNQLRTLPG